MIRNLRSRVACAIAAVCVLAFSACSSQPAGNSTLVFGRNKDAVRLDPAVVTDGMSLNVARLTMEGPTAYGSGSFAIRPALATSWTASPDGKTWIFTLRLGV